MFKKYGWKPWAVGAGALGASVAAGTAIFLAIAGDVGFSIDWPKEMAGVGGYNDAGTLACDAPMDGVDAGDAVDGLWWGDACGPGSAVLVANFTGKADPGATITLWRNNEATLIGTTIATSDGTWSIPGVIIPEGTHTIIAQAVLDGKSTAVTRSMVVDTTPPTWDLDGWEVPPDVLLDGQTLWISLCHCPDWCAQGEVGGLQPCPGGYKCGAGGTCHTDYTADEYLLCKQSRRAGCVMAHVAPPAASESIQKYEFFSADFAQSGSWKVVGGSEFMTKAGGTVTRILTMTGYDPRVAYFATDTVRVKDLTGCNLTGDQVRAVTATAATYIDVTPALSVAVNASCAVENISRFMLDADPRTGTWDMTVGEHVQVRGQVNQPTVATIAALAPWYVTVNSPYLDESVALGDYVDSAEVATLAQQEAWWEGTHFPAWVLTHRCYIPPYALAGVDHCLLPDEWR